MHYAGLRECVFCVAYMRVIRVNAGMVEVPSVEIKYAIFCVICGF